MNRDFNLIDAPWILVRTKDGGVSEVGLRDALLSSHEYVGLAGETKPQDFAVFRLMLAIMYTAFSRYDAEGNEVDEDADPLDYWKMIWDNGQIPKAPIERYLTEWHERFWLFDDEYPFYQTNAVKCKKECATAKMIGTLFESNNKARLFSERRDEGRYLTYAEAARWLLHLMQFDDIAAKDPTPKKTWCGQLSLIALIGVNLFQTLMLNYRADYDADHDVFEEHPSWETDRRIVSFNQQISVPDNQAALLTLQSRNMLLCADNGMVNAYKLAGGDWFEVTAVFSEQMTLWSGYQEKKEQPPVFKPKRYDSSKLIWQEFGSISALAEEMKDSSHFVRPAGVVEWLYKLLRYRLISSDYVVKVCTAAVIYDFKQATSLPVLDAVSDSVSFHAKLLEDISAEWRRRIISEIGKCEKVAQYVHSLYKDLQKAAGRRDKDATESQSGEKDAKQEYYARIDRCFRLWLAELNPDNDRDTYSETLEAQLRRIAIAYGRELVSQVGAQTIFVSNEISAAIAISKFENYVNKLFVAEKKKEEVKEVEQI